MNVIEADFFPRTSEPVEEKPRILIIDNKSGSSKRTASATNKRDRGLVMTAMVDQATVESVGLA